MNKLEMVEVGERQLQITRYFDAAPELVYRAHMDPEITARWMTPPDEGWTLVIEDQGENVYRYTWAQGEYQMPMTMRILEAAPAPVFRIVHTELFDEDWTGGETRNETVFHADGAGTRMELVITYQSSDARAQVLGTDFGEGVAASYANLDVVLAEG